MDIYKLSYESNTQQNERDYKKIRLANRLY